MKRGSVFGGILLSLLAARADRQSWVDLGADPQNALLLGNVCLSTGEVHFFGNASAVDLFKQWMRPYTNWVNYRSEEAHTAANSHEESFDVFLDREDATATSGLATLASPHNVDNNFHLHNDFLFPLLYDMLLWGADFDAAPAEGSSAEAKGELKKTLYLWRGWRMRTENHVMLYEVIDILFDEFVYPMEDAFAQGRHLCFDKFIWAQSKSPLLFYTHEGRFGPNGKYKDAVGKIRQTILHAYGLPVPTPLSRDGLVLRPDRKPHITWVSRPSQPGQRCQRCFKDEAAWIRALRSVASEVIVIDKFPVNQNATKELLSVLGNTDIFLGLHGAGLTNAVYLPTRAVVVEIMTTYGSSKNLFRNMASLAVRPRKRRALSFLKLQPRLLTKLAMQDLRFYRLDVRRFETASGVDVPEETVTMLVEALAQRWQREVDALEHGDSRPTTGECDFPSSGFLASDFAVARCFLERCPQGHWKQCVHHNECGCGS